MGAENTFPFVLMRRRAARRGWVRRRTEPSLSTVIVEFAPVDIALPREWEPTVRTRQPRAARRRATRRHRAARLKYVNLAAFWALVGIALVSLVLFSS